MKKSTYFIILVFDFFTLVIDVQAQKTISVRFKETDTVLTNPGIGSTTFQLFNGDKTNAGVGWTEGEGWRVNCIYFLTCIAFKLGLPVFPDNFLIRSHILDRFGGA